MGKESETCTPSPNLKLKRRETETLRQREKEGKQAEAKITGSSLTPNYPGSSGKSKLQRIRSSGSAGKSTCHLNEGQRAHFRPGRTIACQPEGQLEESRARDVPWGVRKGVSPQDILVGGNFVIFL